MDKFCSVVRMTAAACALCLLLAACGMSKEEQWQEQYDLGQQYLLEGDYEQAIVAFTAAIEIDANLADAYLGRADAYYAAVMKDIGEDGIEYWQFTINFVNGYADGQGTFYAITSVGIEGECSIQAISGELQALYTSGDDEYCAQLPGISWPVRSLSVPGAVSGDIDITQE